MHPAEIIGSRSHDAAGRGEEVPARARADRYAGGENQAMRSTIRLTSVLATLVIVAAACSSAATNAPATPAPATPAPAASEAASAAPPPSEAPASQAAAGLSGTLTLWEAYGTSGSAEKTAFDAIVASVKAANPGLDLTVLDVPFANLFTKFETEAGAGGGPDLFIAPNDSMAKEARAGLLKDLTSLEPQLMAAPYNISQAAITADTVDGKLAAIPESWKAVALFSRNDIFATPPVTTDDWLKDATKLGWVSGSGASPYYAYGLWGAFGGKILNDSGVCDATQTGLADGLKFMSDLKKAGMKQYQDDNIAKADLISGKIGGFIDGPWQSGNLGPALGSKLVVSAGPKGPGGDFQPLAAPDGFYINDASQSSDLAIQFALAYLTDANYQQMVDKGGHIPVNTALTSSDPITGGFITAVKTAFPRPTAKELDNYWANWQNAIDSVLLKGTDPAAAATTACAAMNKANGK
jgi:arabinogalactan oligomer/maltooligosaccharide transport system substrate-binding protein